MKIVHKMNDFNKEILIEIEYFFSTFYRINTSIPTFQLTLFNYLLVEIFIYK